MFFYFLVFLISLSEIINSTTAEAKHIRHNKYTNRRICPRRCGLDYLSGRPPPPSAGKVTFKRLHCAYDANCVTTVSSRTYRFEYRTYFLLVHFFKVGWSLYFLIKKTIIKWYIFWMMMTLKSGNPLLCIFFLPSFRSDSGFTAKRKK